MCQVGDPPNRRDRAQDVRHAGHRHHLHVRAEQLLVSVEVQSEVVGHRDVVERGPRPLGHHLPGDEVGMVLDDGGQDAVTGAEVLQPPSEGDHVQPGGGAPGEDDLSGVGGADEPGNPLSCRFVGIGGSHRELVRPTVDVGVRGAGEAVHSFEDGNRLLGRGTRVEEVDPVGEDGKVGLQVREIGHVWFNTVRNESYPSTSRRAASSGPPLSRTLPSMKMCTRSGVT